MGCRAQVYWFRVGLVHCLAPSATPLVRSVPGDPGRAGAWERGGR